MIYEMEPRKSVDGKKRKEIRDYKRLDKKKSWRKRKSETKSWREEKLLEQLVKRPKPDGNEEEEPENDTATENTLKAAKNKDKKRKSTESSFSSSHQPLFSSSIFKPQPEERRKRTVSIAIPGSILDNAQSLDLRTYLAGQIARAVVIFQIDEIIVFDENAELKKSEVEKFNEGFQEFTKGKPNGNVLLASILQFLDCPQYLRKALFPLRKYLKYAGVLNPLDAPHHLRKDDLSIAYREAVVMDLPPKEGKGAFCNAGLSKPVQIDRSLDSGIRLTLKLKTTDLSKSKLKGEAVRPVTPREEAGIYWGYTVRLAGSLGGVFKDCPHPDGYDLTLGTSEKGQLINDVEMSPGKHTLIVFGGLKGLESCLENDASLTETNPAHLFHHYLNTCPDQGSRTIRTEEAMLISLSALRSPLKI